MKRIARFPGHHGCGDGLLSNAFADMQVTIALFAAFAALLGAAVAWLFHRNRTLRAYAHRLEQHNEELADRNWVLKEAEERARGFLEAQGDFILRRDVDGHITYVNDAFCALADSDREVLLGSD